MATKQTKTQKPKPVRLRQLLTAIKTRRKSADSSRLTQADYAVALDKVIRAIGRSQQQGSRVIITRVRAL